MGGGWGCHPISVVGVTMFGYSSLYDGGYAGFSFGASEIYSNKIFNN